MHADTDPEPVNETSAIGNDSIDEQPEGTLSSAEETGVETTVAADPSDADVAAPNSDLPTDVVDAAPKLKSEKKPGSKKKKGKGKKGKAGKKSGKQKVDDPSAEGVLRGVRRWIAAFTWVRGVVAVLIAALVATVVVLGVHTVHNDRIDSARTSALRAAKAYAVDFSTYNYTTLDTSFAKVSAELTGSFRKQYSSTAAALKSTLVKYQGKATATVQGAGVSSVSPHDAVVIVLLDQTVTSTSSTTPRVDRNRMQVTLQRSGDGRWLMSSLDLK